jgi:hypothetical protein
LVADSSASRVIQQLLLFSGLLGWALVCPAADAISAVPGAHGPQMMLYIKQPLGARGATRIYGLRLDRLSAGSTPTATMPGALPGELARQREIVDLQIRHYTDVRVEFGRRATWNIGRHEFGPSGNQPGMTIRLPMRAQPAPVVARALP